MLTPSIPINMDSNLTNQSSPTSIHTETSQSAPTQLRGRLLLSYNSIYEGELKDNKQHGRGLLKWPYYTIYDGEWKNGEKDGRGIYRNNDDTCYIGYFSK